MTRREFMKRAGTFSAYTTPAVLVLMLPSRDSFARSGGIARTISTWDNPDSGLKAAADEIKRKNEEESK